MSNSESSLKVTLQRALGLRNEIAVVAVHSKKINLPASLIEAWCETAISWLSEVGQAPQTLSFIGVDGFKDADG